jgi:hypothetical protein
MGTKLPYAEREIEVHSFDRESRAAIGDWIIRQESIYTVMRDEDFELNFKEI